MCSHSNQAIKTGKDGRDYLVCENCGATLAAAPTKARHISPWPEQRPPRTEAERAAFAEEQSSHLPKPTADGTLVSDEDLAAMKAAFARRFNEELPRTETLLAVAHIGYRMALRDRSLPQAERPTGA